MTKLKTLVKIEKKENITNWNLIFAWIMVEYTKINDKIVISGNVILHAMILNLC